jgi:hypothetical protein
MLWTVQTSFLVRPQPHNHTLPNSLVQSRRVRRYAHIGSSGNMTINMIDCHFTASHFQFRNISLVFPDSRSQKDAISMQPACRCEVVLNLPKTVNLSTFATAGFPLSLEIVDPVKELVQTEQVRDCPNRLFGISIGQTRAGSAVKATICHSWTILC